MAGLTRRPDLDDVKVGVAGPGPWTVLVPGNRPPKQEDEDRQREVAADPQAGDQVG